MSETIITTEGVKTRGQAATLLATSPKLIPLSALAPEVDTLSQDPDLLQAYGDAFSKVTSVGLRSSAVGLTESGLPSGPALSWGDMLWSSAIREDDPAPTLADGFVEVKKKERRSTRFSDVVVESSKGEGHNRKRDNRSVGPMVSTVAGGGGKQTKITSFTKVKTVSDTAPIDGSSMDTGDGMADPPSYAQAVERGVLFSVQMVLPIEAGQRVVYTVVERGGVSVQLFLSKFYYDLVGSLTFSFEQQLMRRLKAQVSYQIDLELDTCCVPGTSFLWFMLLGRCDSRYLAVDEYFAADVETRDGSWLVLQVRGALQRVQGWIDGTGVKLLLTRYLELFIDAVTGGGELVGPLLPLLNDALTSPGVYLLLLAEFMRAFQIRCNFGVHRGGVLYHLPTSYSGRWVDVNYHGQHRRLEDFITAEFLVSGEGSLDITDRTTIVLESYDVLRTVEAGFYGRGPYSACLSEALVTLNGSITRHEWPQALTVLLTRLMVVVDLHDVTFLSVDHCGESLVRAPFDSVWLEEEILCSDLEGYFQEVHAFAYVELVREVYYLSLANVEESTDPLDLGLNLAEGTVLGELVSTPTLALGGSVTANVSWVEYNISVRPSSVLHVVSHGLPLPLASSANPFFQLVLMVERFLEWDPLRPDSLRQLLDNSLSNRARVGQMVNYYSQHRATKHLYRDRAMIDTCSVCLRNPAVLSDMENPLDPELPSFYHLLSALLQCLMAKGCPSGVANSQPAERQLLVSVGMNEDSPSQVVFQGLYSRAGEDSFLRRLPSSQSPRGGNGTCMEVMLVPLVGGWRFFVFLDLHEDVRPVPPALIHPRGVHPSAVRAAGSTSREMNFTAHDVYIGGILVRRSPEDSAMHLYDGLLSLGLSSLMAADASPVAMLQGLIVEAVDGFRSSYPVEIVSSVSIIIALREPILVGDSQPQQLFHSWAHADKRAGGRTVYTLQFLMAGERRLVESGECCFLFRGLAHGHDTLDLFAYISLKEVLLSLGVSGLILREQHTVYLKGVGVTTKYTSADIAFRLYAPSQQYGTYLQALLNPRLAAGSRYRLRLLDPSLPARTFLLAENPLHMEISIHHKTEVLLAGERRDLSPVPHSFVVGNGLYGFVSVPQDLTLQEAAGYLSRNGLVPPDTVILQSPMQVKLSDAPYLGSLPPTTTAGLWLGLKEHIPRDMLEVGPGVRRPLQVFRRHPVLLFDRVHWTPGELLCLVEQGRFSSLTGGQQDWINAVLDTRDRLVRYASASVRSPVQPATLRPPVPGVDVPGRQGQGADRRMSHRGSGRDVLGGRAGGARGHVPHAVGRQMDARSGRDDLESVTAQLASLARRVDGLQEDMVTSKQLDKKLDDFLDKFFQRANPMLGATSQPSALTYDGAK